MGSEINLDIDPGREKKIVQISRFEMLDVLFGGWRLLL